MADSDLDRVMDLERELQSPATRGDARRLGELLALDFVEIGASGRRWERDAILELLARESAAPDSPELHVRGLEARALTGDVIQVFWESERDGARARRSSLWRRTDQRWQQTYHQGTPLP